MGAKTGRLAAGSELPQAAEYQIGNFTLSWKAEAGGRLAIFHSGEPEKVQWASLPGRAFVGAACGREHVKENRASYTVRDRLVRRFEHQHVERIEGSGEDVRISGSLSGEAGEGVVPYCLRFEACGSSQLGFSLEVEDQAVNRAWLTYASNPAERFFGFGEQFSYFDLKGRRVPVLVSEQGLGRGDQPVTFLTNLFAGAGGSWKTTYAALPHYITSQVRSLYLENSEYMVFDLRLADRVQVQAWSNTLKGRILFGLTPADLIGEYTQTNGRMRPLPDWILEGAIAGMQGGTDAVRRVWQRLEQLDTPLAAFWLQDWVGQRVTSFGKQLWWNWELDEQHYPGWDELRAALANKNIRLMVYFNPFLADLAGRKQVRRNLFQEAARMGYLVKNAGREQPYLILNTDFKAGLVDLTNPDACEWFRDALCEQAERAGVHGWMADFGEALPFDAELASREPAARFHNRYPEAWAALNRKVTEALPNGEEVVYFLRSGFTGSPRHAALFWEGDQMVDWGEHDGIKSAVTGLLSSGLSGFAFNHSDIGGYTTIVHPLLKVRRSKELLLRWMELNAFTTIFRTHEGNRPDDNVQFYSDEECLASFSRLAKVYAAWGFYRKQLVQEAAQTGLPVVRHPFLEFPSENVFWKMRYEQFMVGSELMVAPVLNPGQAAVRLYLPGGKWVHLWTGKEFATQAGRWIEIPAPPGYPGVFYRAGSAVGERLAANIKEMSLNDFPGLRTG